LAVDGEEQRPRGHWLRAARIGNSGNRVDRNLALTQDRDLQPDLRTRADEIIDRCLNSLLRVDRHVHAGNRHVV
jgi:hypothetical protein